MQKICKIKEVGQGKIVLCKFLNRLAMNINGLVALSREGTHVLI